MENPQVRLAGWGNQICGGCLVCAGDGGVYIGEGDVVLRFTTEGTDFHGFLE
jgi:hypothetical protein